MTSSWCPRAWSLAVMNTHSAAPGTQSDERLIDDLLVQMAPRISDLVTALMHRGAALATLGAMFERSFDGTVSGGVGHRAELAKRVAADVRLSDARATLLEKLKTAGHDQLPIVLLVDRG